MELVKFKRKYTAIQVGSREINRTIEPTFKYGDIRGPYYSQEHPEEEFDTEMAAISWAHKENQYARWMIVPIITFDN